MKILLADDDKLVRDTLDDYLNGLLGYELTLCGNGREALDAFRADYYQIVLTDIRMPVMNGIELLRAIRNEENGKKTKVIIFTGFAELETAVAALRDGADDYLFKPIDINKLTDLIENCKNQEMATLGVQSGAHSTPLSIDARDTEITNAITLPGGDRIGIYSKSLQRAISAALKFHEEKDIPVLIEGESGTGKELIAQIIHFGNERNDAPFVAINCPAISPNLFESELFGYESGAFTGAAAKGKRGLLESADGGSIFFDEIGDLPLDMQPKLLRAIQMKEIIRVGGKGKTALNVRFIAASNRKLKQLVADGDFRTDLYHRLNLGHIQLEPLRNEKESIVPLAQFFLNQSTEKRGKKFRLIGESAVGVLEAYDWYGNVRELKNAIDKVTILYDEIELKAEHLSFLELADPSLLDWGKPILAPGGFILPEDGFDISAHEQEIVQMAMKRFGGRKADVARYLGLSYSALRSRLK